MFNHHARNTLKGYKSYTCRFLYLFIKSAIPLLCTGYVAMLQCTMTRNTHTTERLGTKAIKPSF
jgi:hypothetical protein